MAMSTYAREMATKAVDEMMSGPGRRGHREIVADMINAIIERCAVEADPVFDDGSHPCQGTLKQAASRIRALAGAKP